MDVLIRMQDAIDMIYGCEDEFGKDVVFRIADYIRQLPSVQSEIIHCKDCKNADHDAIFDDLWCDGREVSADHYCGLAERKDDE